MHRAEQRRCIYMLLFLGYALADFYICITICAHVNIYICIYMNTGIWIYMDIRIWRSHIWFTRCTNLSDNALVIWQFIRANYRPGCEQPQVTPAARKQRSQWQLWQHRWVTADCNPQRLHDNGEWTTVDMNGHPNKQHNNIVSWVAHGFQWHRIQRCVAEAWTPTMLEELGLLLLWHRSLLF